jgi:hypothetical protein
LGLPLVVLVLGLMVLFLVPGRSSKLLNHGNLLAEAIKEDNLTDALVFVGAHLAGTIWEWLGIAVVGWLVVELYAAVRWSQGNGKWRMPE